MAEINLHVKRSSSIRQIVIRLIDITDTSDFIILIGFDFRSIVDRLCTLVWVAVYGRTMSIFSFKLTASNDIRPRSSSGWQYFYARNCRSIVAVILVACKFYNTVEFKRTVGSWLECNRNICCFTGLQLWNSCCFTNKRLVSFIVAINLNTIILLCLWTHIANLYGALIVIVNNSFLNIIDRECLEVVLCNIVYVQTKDCETVILTVGSNLKSVIISTSSRSCEHVLIYNTCIHGRIRSSCFCSYNSCIGEIFAIRANNKLQVERSISLMYIEIGCYTIGLTAFQFKRRRGNESVSFLIVAVTNQTLRVCIVTAAIVEEYWTIIWAIPTISIVLGVESQIDWSCESTTSHDSFRLSNCTFSGKALWLNLIRVFLLFTECIVGVSSSCLVGRYNYIIRHTS